MTKCTSADVPDLPSLLTPNSVTSDPFKSQPYLPGEIRCKASALNDFSAFTATKNVSGGKILQGSMTMIKLSNLTN